MTRFPSLNSHIPEPLAHWEDLCSVSSSWIYLELFIFYTLGAGRAPHHAVICH